MATSPPAPRLPELLAPAGDWDCVRAAVENGADAIYFGLSRFNARMRAKNFTEADLPALMAFLHRRGVKGYVTFNTLVFTGELAEAEQYLRTIIAAGVDAAIVQDVGICRLIRRLSPDFPIHASTQMSLSSAAGVEFARELGCNLVVLARENSMREIEVIQKEFSAPSPQPSAGNGAEADGQRPTAYGLPLEVFVHGALCVAYSGQCLTSEALGGRSANRGECAQACRMPYELVVDGALRDLGDRRYLLSPQDLSGLEVLPELVRLGVASLKIEGRLKSPEYVASITRVYRRALDQCGTRKVDCGMGTEGGDVVAPNAQSTIRPPQYELEMSFSRGLFTGWFRGNDNQALVHARFGKKRGVFLGEVTRVGRDRVALRPVAPLKAGDGIVFDAGRPDEDEEGGRVFEIKGQKEEGQGDGEVEVTFLRGAVNFGCVHVGDRVWKTDDPALNRELRRTFEGDQPSFQRPVTMEVHGHSGAPLTLIMRDGAGHVARRDSAVPLAVAEKAPLDGARLRDQLGRLGGTPFRLGELVNRLEGAVILPVSELNRLRREAAAELEALRAQPRRWKLHEAGLGVRRQGEATVALFPTDAAPAGRAEGGAALRMTPQSRTPAAATDPELIALVRTSDQLDAALACGVRTICCEFEDPKRYRGAVTRVQTAGGCAARPEVFLAPPRIFKPGEDWILRLVESAAPDGFLVRNAEHLRRFAGRRCVGDFSLNVANPLTAEWFMERHALEHVTASYDLNVEQLEALLRAAPPAWFEVTLHQHVPMFHMEHCVFCAFLSKGKDYRDCGRPCDRHEVRLRDRVGAAHLLKADAGCRNTVFNARAQTGAEFVGRFLAAGARRFRIELLDESGEESRRLIAQYRRLLRGEITGGELWREFKLVNQLGITRGQLERAAGVDVGENLWAAARVA
ncbi:MAG: peptidase U32 family protein [Limisphaerales bacterium]